MIVEINNKTITCTNDLVSLIEKTGNKELSLKYIRDGKLQETKITPMKTSDNHYKLGLWVRDAAARYRYCYIL